MSSRKQGRGGKKGGRKAPAKKGVKHKPLEHDFLLEDAIHTENNEMIALSMVNLIVERGAAIIYQHYLEAEAQKRTAVDTIENCVQAVEMQLAPHDFGEVSLWPTEEEQAKQIEKQNGADDEDYDTNPMAQDQAPDLFRVISYAEGAQNWVPESEPPICEIDRWARGVMPVRKRHKGVTEKFLDSLRDSNTERPASVKSAMSTGSRQSYARSHASRTSFGSRGSLRVTKRKTPMELFLEDKEAVPIKIETKVTPGQRERDRIRNIQLRRMERERMARQKKLEEERLEEEAKKRFQKLKEELKGKNYTFDENGSVILIKPLGSNGMPKLSTEPKVRIGSLEEESKKSRRSAYGRRANNSSRNGRRRKPKRRESDSQIPRPPKRRQKPKEFEDVCAVQPPLTETMKIRPGVTLKVSGTIKQAEPDDQDVENDEDDVTTFNRTQYSAYLDEQTSAGNIFARTDKMQVESKTGEKKSQNKTKTAPESAHVKPDEEPAGSLDVPESILSRDDLPASTTDSSFNDTLLTTSPGPQSPNGGSFEVQDSVHARGKGRRRKQAKHQVTEDGELLLSSSDVFNITLMADPRWGENPTTTTLPNHRALPPKPAPEVEHRIYGARVPRHTLRKFDKSTTMPLNSPNRAHLPPPLYPRVMGHGEPGYLAKTLSPSKLPQVQAQGGKLPNVDPSATKRHTDYSAFFGRKKKEVHRIETTDAATMYFRPSTKGGLKL